MMSRLESAIPAALIVALGAALSGCSSSGPTFDPTDWIAADWMQKPKLAGDRKPVFPNGVPGVEQGVPKELVKGQHPVEENPSIITAEEPPAEAKPKQAEAPRPQPAKPKPRTASVKPQPQPVASKPTAAPAAQQQPAQQTTSEGGPAWPDPTTAQANWPPPNPNTFSR